MSTNIERLRNDPNYWERRGAPREATHAHIYPDGTFQWVIENPSGAFNSYWHQRFSEWQRKERPIEGYLAPRPEPDNAARNLERLIRESGTDIKFNDYDDSPRCIAEAIIAAGWRKPDA